MARQQKAQDEARWGGLLAAFAQQDSGSVRAFCAAHRITAAQFYYRRRQWLARQSRSTSAQSTPPTTGPAFREYALASLAPPTFTSPACTAIRLHLGEVMIELLPGFDPEALRQVLSCCR